MGWYAAILAGIAALVAAALLAFGPAAALAVLGMALLLIGLDGARD